LWSEVITTLDTFFDYILQMFVNILIAPDEKHQ